MSAPIFAAGTAISNLASIAGHLAAVVEGFAANVIANGSVEAEFIQFLHRVTVAHMQSVAPPAPAPAPVAQVAVAESESNVIPISES